MGIIKNKAVAAKLVLRVLEDQYNIDELKPSKKLRQVLKTDLLNRCIYWKQFAILDRPPVKVPSRRHINSQLN